MKARSKTALGIRLERLRTATGKTWDALAADLGLKRAMLFHVMVGRREFSAKTLRRLVDLEVREDLRSNASAQIELKLRDTDLIAALLERTSQSEVTSRDIDKRFKQVGLEYRRGRPPNDYPKQIIVNAASNATVLEIHSGTGMGTETASFLAECLTALKRKPDLLEHLTPFCYARILNTALDLTFGLNWRARFAPEHKVRLLH